MRKSATIAIFVATMFAAMTGFTPKCAAEMSVSIGINLPLPRVVLHAPPPMVVIPGTYAYYAPDTGMEIFFYHGYWYRPHHGHWYRARGYNGPWRTIKYGRVPHAFRNLPPDFRRTVRHDKRIRYADFHKNWKLWEKEKHWDRRIKRDEVRKVRHGAKVKINLGNREARKSQLVDKKKINRSPYEVRNVGHDEKPKRYHSSHGWRVEKKGKYED